jgi:hypothetical protein
MRKRLIIAIGLILALLITGLCSSQGMGNSKPYDGNSFDWMGTPVISSAQVNAKIPDYLNPYNAQRPEWDPYGPGANPQLGRPEWDPFGAGLSALGLQLEPADPTREGLAVGGGLKFANQLYLQKGQQLLTQGALTLGEPYVLWARVTGKGSFLLYDYNRQILNQGYVTPGWYKINGAYADFVGQHIYRFVSGGQASNNLSLIVDSGIYPTSFSLTGRVVNQNGQGMPGVKVIVSNNDGGRFSTITGRDGFYAIDVATGVYLVNAELPGYIFTQTMVQALTGLVSAARPVVGTSVANTSPSVWP